MNEMKLLLLLLAGMAALAGDLSQVHTVYILSMSGGLDLHIANRLTEGHVLQVVTDPKNADAILTDKLGPGFEDRMADLYPPPEPPKPEPKAADKDKNKDKDKDKDKDKNASTEFGLPGLGEASNKIPKLISNFGGGKGTVFLVGVKSRDVLWSTYAKPKDARGEQMEKTAGKICADLKKSMGAK